MNEPLRPEDRLVLLLVRRRIDGPVLEQTEEILRGALDWPCVFNQARQQSVFALFYQRLVSIGPESIPSRLRQRLREEFYASVRHNLLLTHELHRVLHTLKGQGIPALAYKGPIWAAGLHGNLSARSFCDLDILVNKADVLKAKDLLAGQGYVPEHALGRLQEWWKLLFDCEYRFDNTGSGVHLEVHWRIVPGYVRFRLEMLDVWQSSGTVVLSGQEVPTLSRQDALSVLCIHHGGKHLWSHLQGLVDLDRLVGAPGPFDWTDFLRRATGQGLLRILCVGFELARRLLDTPVPEEVNSILQRDETGKRIAARIHGTMMEQGKSRFRVGPGWLSTGIFANA